MKKLVYCLLFVIIGIGNSFSQSCNVGGPGGTYNFFTSCQGGTSYSGTDYTLTIGNNKTIILNGDMTLSGTLTIVLVGSTSKLFIASPNTLTAANITFSGSATGKVIEIEGPSGAVNVSGTVNFGGLDIELDGEGSLSAGAITGADNVSCTSGVNGGTGTCPSITAGSCSDGGSGLCSDPALPIELGSFTAKVSGNNVKLDWVTLSEINNDYFSIEKSSDGINYNLITTVNGAGNSVESIEYSYTDTNPSFGKSYYRLKQTDFDGASETFAPIAVEFTSLENGKLTFSNPVNAGETVSIFTNAESTEKLTLSVFSMMGHEILNEEFIGSSYEFKIDASVEPGIYFVKVSSVNSERTGRLVVK